MRKRILLLLPLLLSLVGPNSSAALFGLKSCGSNSPSCTGALTPNSLPPTRLYSFAEDGSAFTDVGAVTANGTLIDADGLALSQRFGLIVPIWNGHLAKRELLAWEVPDGKKDNDQTEGGNDRA
ncbi:MAG: hypothetical protein K0U93_12675 [Gammaproteobacteria bacterium]|nr:hypothetical protein [Gammaproteobacteria bacterium]